MNVVNPNMTYDDLESTMASMVGGMMMMYRGEVEIKRSLVKHFKVDIEFEYEYKDLKMIIPNSLRNVHPVINGLEKYEWVFFSDYTDGNIIFMNRKATEVGLPKPKKKKYNGFAFGGYTNDDLEKQ